MIIKTSDLGYSFKYFDVNTNCNIDELTKIDLQYGMQYRHQSTTIKQLQEGAIKEGFKFEFKELKKEKKYKSEKDYDYFARYGNY